MANANGYENNDRSFSMLPELKRFVTSDFEVSSKPSFLEHLPSLTRKFKASRKPKVVEKGTRTLAAPLKEKPFYRHVSDAIGNNYSPNAKNLTTSLVYAATRFGLSGEELYLQSGGKLHASDGMLTFNNGQRSRYALNAIRGARSGGNVTKSLNHPATSQQPTARSDQNVVGTMPNGRLEALKEQEKPQEEQPDTLPSARSHPYPAIGTAQAVRRKRKHVKDHQREHDAATAACLEVSFPPWYKASIGMSRPPTPEPRSIARYARIAETAVDGGELDTLPESQAERIVEKLSSLPGEHPLCAVQLMDEVTRGYTRAMKFAVLNYILRDPEEQQRLGLRVHFDSSARSAGRESFPWHENVVNARNFLQSSMYTYHEVTLMIQTYFQKNFSEFRFIDFEELESRSPLTIDEFAKLVEEQTDKARAYLQDRWLVGCCKIVEDRIRDIEIMVAHDDPLVRSKRMDSFFDTLAQLMCLHLCYMTESTIKEFVDLFEQYSDGNQYDGEYHIVCDLALPRRQHVIRVFIEEDFNASESIRFEPQFAHVVNVLNTAVEQIVFAGAALPRIETRLFHPIENIIIGHIKSVILQDKIVVDAKRRINYVVSVNLPGLEKYSLTYTPYAKLLKKATTDEILQFIATPSNKLSDYVREIEELKRMSNEVGHFRHFVPMRLFLLDCTPINQWLQKRASEFVTIMVDRIAETSRAWNRQICVNFDEIVSKISSQSESTAQLVDLQRYVNSLPTGDLAVLQKYLDVAAQNVLFLMDYAYLPHEDIVLNHATFNWPMRIGPITQSAEAKLQRERDIAIQKLADSVTAFGARLAELHKEVKEFSTRYQMSEAEQHLRDLEEANRKLIECREEKRRISNEEVLLDSETRTEWPQLNEIQAAKDPFDKLWNAAVRFHKAYDAWMNGPLLEVNAEEVEDNVQQFWRTAYRLTRYFAQADMRNPLRVAISIKSKLDKFKLNLPLIMTVSTPGLKERHWKLMSDVVGYDVMPTAETKFTDFLQLGLEKHLEELGAIAAVAAKEFALEKALKKMKTDWANVRLNMVPYKQTGVQILAAIDEVQVLLDDHLLKTMTMKGSPHIKVFEAEVNQWDAKLHRTKSSLDSWLIVQADWTYLQQIFSSADIRRQMPKEGEIFLEVDRHWRKVTDSAAKEPNALVILAQPELLETLKRSQKQLEMVQKGLKEYLEKKRMLFPRFFFLSNDELIEILSETRDPLRVQPHLKKCFEGISRLRFTDQYYVIGMRSAEDELVSFVEHVFPAEAQGLVEQWLIKVEQAMRKSLQNLLHRAVLDLGKMLRRKWIFQWPQQISVVGSCIQFTADATRSIETQSLADYHSRFTQQVDELVTLIRDQVPKAQRLMLQTLLIKELHHRDVIGMLRDRKVDSTQDFNWIGQLRHYYDFNNRALFVRMVITEIEYGFEYLGNQECLVITPLTERCFRTVMSAINLNLGSSPEGPAGTGKTETCKELARSLAVQCLVFNCSEGLDYIAMGKFLKGVALTGAFSVFDEFNRIEVEVLSVIAQQLQNLQRNIAQRVPKFMFEGSEISAKRCCISITMNPDYAGRATLPDNLKALFRPIAMVAPDYTMIAEITLYASGFVSAKQLAGKIVATYRLCNDQLSAQAHYDYGMRALKTVLSAASQLKLRFYNETNEDALVLKSLIDVNLPKLVPSDVPLFEGILADLFPRCEPLRADRVAFLTHLGQVISKRNLQPLPAIITRCVQLYEIILVRHGVMLVGEPLSAKSTLYQLLAATLQSLADAKADAEEHGAEYVVIYPKALTLEKLYGRYDLLTHDWYDGALATLFRGHATHGTPSRKWTIFDGPIDPIWVESLNTLLDDNKKLCLMSGEAIQMSHQQTVLFETESLENASPATVSRCGMIYSSAQSIGLDTLWQNWLRHSIPCQDFLAAEHIRIIELMIGWLLPPVVNFVARNCTMLENLSDMHLVLNFLRLYSVLLEEIRLILSDEDEDLDPGPALMTAPGATSPQSSLGTGKPVEIAPPPDALSPQKALEERQNWVVASLVFALVNSVGSCIDGAGRIKFDEFFKVLCESDTATKFPKPKDLKVPRSVFFPKKGAVYDYVFLRKPLGAWYQWPAMVTKSELPEGALDLTDVLVSTAETERQQYFLSRFVQQQIPFVFIGTSGTGKTSIINSYVESLGKDKWLQHNITLSALTTAQQMQDSLFTKLEKRGKGVYGQSGDKKLVLLVDDLNMPQKEQFGAQPPLELLRQILDQRFVYDLNQAGESCQIRDLVVLAAMPPISSGRASLPTRLFRHLFACGIQPFDDELLKSIFSPLMDYHLNHGFDNSIRRFSRVLIGATIDLYKQCLVAFVPTPARSHYLFNLRDVANVVYGCMQLKPKVMPVSVAEASQRIIRLWVHESYRVFHDRLVEDEERETFFRMIKAITEVQFKERMVAIFGDLVKSGDKQLTRDMMSDLVFCNFSGPKPTGFEPRFYNEAPKMDTLTVEIQQYLDDYNAQSKTPIDLVIFTQMVEHISRITRVLMRAGGHCLSIGVGGSGRESVAELATFMADCELYRIEVTTRYSVSDWHDDLRKLVRRVGLDCLPTVFLFGDHQVKHISFLEDINYLLNNADIPNLFPREERLEIIDKMQQVALQDGLSIEQTPVNMYNLFLNRVREHLHLIITLSPIGDKFRNYIRQFPSLTGCCAIDWFTSWSTEALEKVAYKYLEDVEMTSETRDQCVLACKYFQEHSMKIAKSYYSSLKRRVWVTPNSFLEMLRTFRTLLTKKRNEVFSQKTRYAVGLEKLHESEKQIAIMRQELELLTPQLVETSRETEELIKVIESEKVDIELAKSYVESEEAVADANATKSKEIRDECEKSLQIAMPAMLEATNALDTLKPQDIAVVKTLQNPPIGVKIVMEAVCILKGIKPLIKVDEKGKQIEDYWPAAKKLVGDMNFLNTLKEYDKDSIPPAVIKKIRDRYINNPDFDPETIRSSSSACEGLCLWVRAVEVYDRIAKVIAPKKAKLREADELLKKQLKDLQDKREQLAEVTRRLEAKKQNLRAKESEKKDLENQIELCKLKIQRAEKIIVGLGGEKTRWAERVKQLSSLFDSVVADVLLSSAIVAYLGPFIPEYRQDCSKKWYDYMRKLGLTVSDDFSIINVFGDPVVIRDWQLQSLPKDSVSTENAIIATMANRWPLLIDPQRQYNRWIKNMEMQNRLSVVKLTDTNYVRVIRNCVEFGNPCLLENVGEQFDPVLETVFMKQIFKQSGVDSMRVGDEIVTYSRDFKLYITTRLQNPTYMPEWSTKLNIICVISTPTGLEEQLKSIAVLKERPDLEEKKNELVLENARSKKELKSIEDKILEVLYASKGDILGDETAIEILASSKEMAKKIEEKQLISAETEREIDEARSAYESLGTYSSVLFFTATSLSNINALYQFSLQWFTQLFETSIANSEQKDNITDRIAAIQEHFTQSFYEKVSRALYEKDQLVFSALLCVGLAKRRGEVTDAEWMFLLRGASSSGVMDDLSLPNPHRSWLPDSVWNEIRAATQQLPCFARLAENVLYNPEKWQPFYECSDPHRTVFPEPFNTSLNAIQRVILVRCIRVDKTVLAMQDYITSQMGNYFLEPPTFDLVLSYADSSPVIPVCLFLSPGSDPITSIYQLADQLILRQNSAQQRRTESRFSRSSSMLNKLQRQISGASGNEKGDGALKQEVKTLSLGQGQGKFAEQAIFDAAKSGSWVVLQNCHLAGSWLSELERICLGFVDGGFGTPHKDFRMWLTLFEPTEFPVTVLRESVKVTCETPKDLKANLLRSYMNDPVSQADFYEFPTKPVEFQKLLFSLSFFHAMIQERKKAGPLGWNAPYEFTDADFRISAQQLRSFIADYDAVPFEALTYLAAECNYGGRITDERDRVLLRALLDRFYCTDAYNTRNYKICNEYEMYTVPEAYGYDHYIEYIKSLPLNTPPPVFGLHENATVFIEQTAAQTLFDSALLTLPRQNSGSQTQQILDSLIVSISKKIPDKFSLEDVKSKYPTQYNESLNAVLYQEVTAFNQLTVIIRQSLEELQKSLKGQSVMSAELEQLADSLVFGKVPEMWLAKSYPNVRSLGGYISDLVERLRFFHEWVDKGIPAVFWISGFFYGQSFLTGVLQNFARRNIIPVDNLDFDHEVTTVDLPENVRVGDKSLAMQKPAFGVYVRGLILEGARWSRENNTLEEAQPKVLFDLMPIIWIKPTAKSAIIAEGFYSCPVYKTAKRGRTYLCDIRLPSVSKPSHWIERGVALVGQREF